MVNTISYYINSTIILLHILIVSVYYTRCVHSIVPQYEAHIIIWRPRVGTYIGIRYLLHKWTESFHASTWNGRTWMGFALLKFDWRVLRKTSIRQNNIHRRFSTATERTPYCCMYMKARGPNSLASDSTQKPTLNLNRPYSRLNRE